MKGDLLDHMRWTLLFGKYAGFMPIVGLESSGENPRFRWKSLCTFIYIINFVIMTFMVWAQVYGFFFSGFDVMRLNGLIFFIIHFILCCLLFLFCYRLGPFLTNIQTLEKLLPPAWKPRSAVKRANRMMAAIVFFGTVEHVMYVIHSVLIANFCYRLEEDSGWYIKSYFVVSFEWYFEYFPFSYIPPIIFQIVKTQAGVMWFYGNWFIMCASIYLRNRFEDFNRLIIDEKSMFTKNFKPSWLELQVHYTRLSKLVAVLDTSFNATVFVAYTSNLYCVCLEMYFILNNLTDPHAFEPDDCVSQHENGVISVLVRIYSTFSMVLRTVIFSYLASEVYVASRRSLMVLHSTTALAHNGDMQRLMIQIYYSKLGVTGLNFFKITRGMLLAMVAKLLTYELVLVQF